MGPGSRALLLRLAAVLLALLPLAAHVPGAAAAGRRVALVIGNSEYRFAPQLANPANDSASVGARLRAAGFEVLMGQDLTRLDMEEQLKRFQRTLDGAETALFYYSGHAVQVAGRNFLVPVDAELGAEADLELAGIDIDTVLGTMRTGAQMQLVFLDACRDNPFANRTFAIGATRQVSPVTRGLARLNQGLGTLIAFSTAPGTVAFDGEGALSPFTASFVRWVLEPGLEIRQLLTRVRNDVSNITKGRQVPWENSALAKDFFFLPPTSPPVMPPLQQVKLPAGATEVQPLALVPPTQPAGGSVRVVFDTMPTAGSLQLAGRTLAAGETIEAPLVRSLAFSANQAKPGTVDMIALRARDDFGGETRGMVAVAFEAGLPASPAATAPDQAMIVQTLKASLERKATEVPAGLGAQPVRLAATTGSESAIVEVTGLPVSGTLLLGGRPLAAGTRLAAADLGQIGFVPDREKPEAAQRIAMRVDVPGKAPVEATATVTGTLDQCDALGGEPFDPQGVGQGKLPNELKARDVVAACSRAVTEHPEIPRFLYQLGRGELAAGNVAVARAAFEKAAARGHVRSLYGLGLLNVHGAFKGADKQQGFKLLEDGAAKGDPYAMHALGKRLINGDGIAPDVDRGFRLLVRAAEFGHTYAMNELGFQYKTGRNIQQDLRRSLAYYRASVDRQDIYGFNNLGLMLRDGIGLTANVPEAYKLFLKAARGGHPDAPFNIALMYEKGIGVPRDPQQVSLWYKLGVERGDPWSALRLAEISTQAGKPDEAALYLMQAAGFGKGQPSEQAKARLAELPLAARREAAIDLAATLKLGNAQEGEKLLARAAKDRGLALPKGLDDLSVALAREAWLKDKPRFDLF